MSLQSERPTENRVAEVRIERAGARELPIVSETLGRAFFDDPVFAWVIPDEGERRRTIAEFFMLFARAVQPYDEICLADSGVGAALWVPPGQPPVAPEFEKEFVARSIALAGEHAVKLGAITEAMEKHHPTEPHQYLWFLGVNPAWQGRGVGSALLQPVLERCDRKSTPAYLEATSPNNVRLYERHGFDVIGIIDEHGGAPLWPMWREPRAN
jgi:ribosomal protein S18 acetylase RimI-like enzyme